MSSNSPQTAAPKQSQRSKSAPVQLSEKHILELMESGLTEEQALATHHRTVTAQEAGKASGHFLPGLLFTYGHPTTRKPYQILTGKWSKKPFTRLKPDWAKADPAKREGYADEDGNLPKYLSPKDSGSRPYFSPLMDWGRVLKKSSIPIVLTEGEKKGDAGCAIGIPTIAGSGVSAFVDRNSRGEWSGGVWLGLGLRRTGRRGGCKSLSA